jgi:hypothetical protein
MTEQLKNLLIMLGGIAVVLLIVILLFSGKSPFRRFMTMFLDDGRSGGASASAVQRSAKPAVPEQKYTSEPIVVMATLVRKCDKRNRIIESTGQERIEDEYYELLFVTRKGQKLKIECSAASYEKVPFNQQGSLTYRRNMLVKFKYYGDTIIN